jgi:TolB-like protein/Tfp pilus assembly protein PilF
VSAALKFQHVQAGYLETLVDDIKPILRIGVTVGEVVFADKTVTGAGVVLAQRIEQIAQPGEVCLQGAVYEIVPRRLPFRYENLGEHEVKGFEEAVRVYTVRLDEGKSIPKAELLKGKSQWLRVAVVSILILIIIALGWTGLRDFSDEWTSADSIAIPQPNQPSIAVLPFSNLSDDPEQVYFSDGMTDDLITDLSKIPGLIVISRTSSFAYRGKSEDVRVIGKALNVRYIVEGSTRRAGGKIRINAQLIDATTGHHVWAERYDNAIENIFTLQDQITKQVVEALETQLDNISLKVEINRATNDLKAYDLFLQGSGIFQRFSKDDTYLARDYFRQTIALDPKFSRAYAMLAWTYVFEYTNGWAASPKAALQQGMDIANKSIALESRSPVAHFVKGLVYRERKEFVQALVEAKTSIEIEPSYANGYVLTATLLYYAGKPELGLSMLDIASRLNPLHPSNYPFHRGQALFILKRYNEAIEAFEFGLTQNPTSQRLRVWLAATYAQIDQLDEATWEANEILIADPDFSPTHLESIFPFQNSEDLKTFNSALNKAGFKNLSNKLDR